MQNEIIKIGINEEAKLDHENYIKIGAFTKKAADFINSLIYSEVRSCKKKRCTRYSASYSAYDVSTASGGGLLVQGQPEVCMTYSGNVIVHFCNNYKAHTCLRKCSTSTEFADAAKAKIAYALKDYWRAKARYEGVDEDKFVMPIHKDHTEQSSEVIDNITFNEYRSLYECLLNRNSKKTIEKYGKEAYDAIVSEPKQDQFVFTAVESIETMIKELETERDNKSKLLHDECWSKKQALNNEYNDRIAESNAEYNKKIDGFKQQIADLLHGMNAELLPVASAAD